MDLKEYIPFEKKEFRPHQEETIKKAIEEIENGTETILINAPVGFGKSIVGYCIAKHLQQQGEQSYIYTKTTFLQDQYLRDFKDVKTAMGRANFECLMSGDYDYMCDFGICKQQNKYSCPIGAETIGGVVLRDIEGTEYELALSALKPEVVSEDTDVYVILAGKLVPGQVVYRIPLNTALPEGIYNGTVVTEKLTPISLLMN